MFNKPKENGNDKNNDYLKKSLDSIVVALPRVVITFGAGHPFDLVKTRMQANPFIHSGVLLSKEIFQKTGIKGFYTGGVPNLARALLKETYRSPLRGGINYLCNQSMPGASPESKSILTGVSMAISDTMIICPLERIKVWLMTNYQENNRKLTSFFNLRDYNELPIYKDLFKGASVSMVRSTMSWVSFLVAEGKIRRAIAEWSPRVENANDLPFAEQILVGSLSGIINGICTLPFDTIKTNVQKEENVKKVSLESMYKTGKELVKTHGFVKGLYPSFLTKLVHYSIVAIVTSDIIQRVDRIWQDDNEPSIRNNNKK